MKEQDFILSAWTPHTTRVLESGGSMAWQVLDHVMENTHNAKENSGKDCSFVTQLQEELKSTGLLDQLRPAKTKSDVELHQVLSSLMVDTQIPTTRGDVSAFVSREYRQEPHFDAQHACLSRLIQSIETTAIQAFSKSNLIHIDTSLTSVQLAMYPGDGKSGYIRHCDVGNACQEEISIKNDHDSNNPQRIITAVYYPTPSNWNATCDNGALRLYLDDKDQHYNVIPYPNRLVLFRSDCVSHQVMPSLRQSRLAITIWLYGHFHNKNKNHSNQDNVKPPFLVPPMSINDKSCCISTDIGLPPLAIEEVTQQQQEETIFVSIASHCDSELVPTLQSLFETAQYPRRVFVGVVWQVDTAMSRDEMLSHYNLSSAFKRWWWNPTRVQFLTLDARNAQGPCHARYLCQSLWQGQDYVLQIDSHMRFRPYWDTHLIQQLQMVGKQQNNLHKTMLTTYPVGYQLPNHVPNKETRGTILVPWKFDQDDGLLRQRARLFHSNKKIQPCRLYAAGFNFCTSAILQTCPYQDLKHLFFGEEISMAIRLYTHGYDLYAPRESVVYHLWSRRHRQTVEPVNQDQVAKGKRQSLRMVQNQLRGVGLGTERTMDDYCQELGVDFETKTIKPRAELGPFTSEQDFVSFNLLDETFGAALQQNSSSRTSQDEIDAQQQERGAMSIDPKAQALIASFLGDL